MPGDELRPVNAGEEFVDLDLLDPARRRPEAVVGIPLEEGAQQVLRLRA